MNSLKMEFLLLVHELIESYLCKDSQITEAEIDRFDLNFEKNRDCDRPDLKPGDSVDAPYYKQHQFAVKIEKILATFLRVDWGEYDRKIADLTTSYSKTIE